MSTSTIFEGRYRLQDQLIASDGSRSRKANTYVQVDKARVYLATDETSGEKVAIKLLDQWTSRDPRFKSRFEAETKAIRSLEHPYAVKNLTSGVTSKGLPYLVMEHLPGRTLDELISNQGPVTPLVMAEYLEQIASALDAAHALRIVHRDVSPYSVMLHAEADGKVVVKLLDFGLARDFLEKDPLEVDLTGKAKTMGKAPYLSPERARGDEEDWRSDIYSLGVTLYEALTGRLPFDGKTDFQMILAHINTPVPPFPEGWSDLPSAPAIEAVVLKAMSKNPSLRPQSAGELAALFRSALLPANAKRRKVSWPLLAAGAAILTALAVFASRFVS